MTYMCMDKICVCIVRVSWFNRWVTLTFCTKLHKLYSAAFISHCLSPSRPACLSLSRPSEGCQVTYYIWWHFVICWCVYPCVFVDVDCYNLYANLKWVLSFGWWAQFVFHLSTWGSLETERKRQGENIRTKIVDVFVKPKCWLPKKKHYILLFVNSQC